MRDFLDTFGTLVGVAVAVVGWMLCGWVGVVLVFPALFAIACMMD
jgi:hypothetical protein